jgi:hypothetical protein
MYNISSTFWRSRPLLTVDRGRNFCHNQRRGAGDGHRQRSRTGNARTVGRDGQGVEEGAIGYISNIVIGVASTAPAYSLAATLGFIVVVKGVGVHAPAVMLVAFVPMLLVA